MKMKKLLYMGLFAVTMTACDAHRDFPDLGTKVGDVVCTDGSVMRLDDYEASGKKAVAVVFHVAQSEDDESYGVYLHDLQPTLYADSLGVKQGTSADISAFDGNQNTYALFDNRNVGSPLAEAVFDIWQYGQSAYIPSVAQYRRLYGAKDVVNQSLLRLGGDIIPDEADDCWYWSSTEVAGQETAKAWLYSLGSGAIQETPKLQSHKSRPIITLSE